MEIKPTTYFVFENKTECLKTVSEINKKRNGEWSQPHKNQTENLWILPYNDQIKDCKEILQGFEEITRDEAIKRGWYFGPFTGSFAREREKLEDIHFVYDSLLSLYGRPNFPAIRAMTLSFLSACYSLKESMNKKINGTSLKEKLEDWWKLKLKEQSKRNDVLNSFHVFMNTEKHGGASTGQISDIVIEPVARMTSLIVTNHHIHADPKSLEMSAQGAFMTAYKNTPQERRFPVGLHEAVYEIRVKNAPKEHIGHNVQNATFLDFMTIIRNYYMSLLFEAETLIEERNNNSIPAMLFDGDASMHVQQ